MALTIQSSGTARERILVYGAPGSGKSYAWQCILAATPDHVRFHVIDTDAAWESARDSEQFAPYDHRVTLTEPNDWLDYVDAIKRAKAEMNRDRGDWFVVDLADHAWDAAQSYYEDRKYDGSAEWTEAFINRVVDGTVADEDKDVGARWGAINKLYSMMRLFVVRAPGNVFIAATEKDFKKDRQGNYLWEEDNVIRDFGKEGVKPGGQKHLPYDVRSTMHLIRRGNGSREIKMIKERNREHIWDGKFTRPHTDFTRDLLMSVYGWEPVVEAVEAAS